MPIEIRELVIKASVVEEGTTPATGGDRSNNTVTPGEEIIRLCVERVLEILEEKSDR